MTPALLRTAPRALTSILTRVLPTGLLLASLVSACSDAKGGDAGARTTETGGEARNTRQLIAGGELSEERAVVAVERTDRDLELCSGVLLTPSMVLTAAHCLMEAPRSGSCDQLQIGNKVEPSSLRVTTVDDLSKAPDDSWKFYQGSDTFFPGEPSGSLCGRDIGLLLLAEPIPEERATPISVARAPVAEEEAIVALGYGAGHVSGAGERRRRTSGALKVVCVGADCSDRPATGWAGASARLAPEVRATEFLTDPGPCPGDSGGPALRDGKIVGILSRGYDDCSAPVFGLNVPALAAQMRQLASDGKIELPNWAAEEQGDAMEAGGARGDAEGGMGGLAPAEGRPEGGAGSVPPADDEAGVSGMQNGGCGVARGPVEKTTVWTVFLWMVLLGRRPGLGKGKVG